MDQAIQKPLFESWIITLHPEANLDADPSNTTEIVKYFNPSVEHAWLMWQHIAEMMSKQLAGLQCKLDEVMLEYCPEDMSAEQFANWAAHQKTVSPERLEEIIAKSFTLHPQGVQEITEPKED